MCNAQANDYSEQDETIQLAVYLKPHSFWVLIIALCLKTQNLKNLSAKPYSFQLPERN